MAANDIMKLPSDIISKILVRLESLELLVRCKLVCREWREVLRSREFILTHYAESSSKPFSFLVHHLDTLTGEHTITIHNHAMDNLDYTAPNVFPETAVVGIVKGVVCLCSLQLGNQVMLWNPFLTQFLEIPHPVENEPIEEDRCVSIGVGCEGITVFVIRISHSSVSTPLRVQVFNTNSFVWEVIENDISICGFISPYCDTVVKGCPCWVIMGEDRKITQFHLCSRSMILLTFPDIGPSNYLMFELRDKLSILSWNTGELELTIWQYNDIKLGWTHFTKFKVPRGLHRIIDIVGEKEIVGEAIVYCLNSAMMIPTMTMY